MVSLQICEGKRWGYLTIGLPKNVIIVADQDLGLAIAILGFYVINVLKVSGQRMRKNEFNKEKNK